MTLRLKFYEYFSVFSVVVFTSYALKSVSCCNNPEFVVVVVLLTTFIMNQSMRLCQLEK